MQNAASKEEADQVSRLLMEDRKLWSHPCIELVSDRVEEMCCGWKPVRPSATYDLRKPTNNKRRKAAATLTAANTLSVNVKNDKSPYMSGDLDEKYSYVYDGGLSSRAEGSGPHGSSLDAHFSSRPRNHVQTVTLEPSAANEASVQALAHCRDELSRILALQLKPELLVEQLIIENRLRTMSLAAFPICGGPPSRRSERTYSQSTPSLLPNTHVNYQPPRHSVRGRRERATRHRTAARREAKQPQLQWCDSMLSHKSRGVNQTARLGEVWSRWPPPELSHQQSPLHRRNQASTYRHDSTKPAPHNPRVFAATESSPSLPLPVVSPTLAPDGQRKSINPPPTLLYKPEGNSRQHKSNSLTIGSSFYYPSISYSNSKHHKN